MHQVPHRAELSAKDSLAAGATAGLVGGTCASWLMEQFQSRVLPSPKNDHDEPSTNKLVRKLAGLRSEEPLTDEQAKSGGKLVHYALGAGLGLLYGTVASVRPEVATGAGLPFGMAVEIVIDQGLVPATGLSKPFWKYPADSHLRGIAAHLVFGLATEATRRLIILLMDAASPKVIE